MLLNKTLLLTFALLGAGPAIAQTPVSTGHAGMAMGNTSAPSTAPGADTSMMDSMAKMNQTMNSAPMTGNTDHDFVVMMLPHHQGAVDMAKFELQHGKDPELRKLAHDVIASQDKEIVFMKSWLAKHPAK